MRHPRPLTRRRAEERDADTIVIGSGFGGCMAAHALVAAGERVTMLERGGWVSRSAANWDAFGSAELTPHVWHASAPQHRDGRRLAEVRQMACVGGPSVFYGGVSLRFREADFAPRPEVTEGSGAAWPVGYGDLEAHYAEAERLLDVAGVAGDDPTEPPRSGPLPQPPTALSATAQRVGAAAREIGLTPSRLPLAINHRVDRGRSPCVRCGTCDTFACAVAAKNDLAATLVPALVRRGLELRPHTLAVGLVLAGDRVVAVRALDLRGAREVVLRARRVVLAAGALASAHLVLASGVHERSPAPDVVGRYLTRHCSAIAFGVFPRRLEPEPEFHKQLGFHDLYHGARDAPVAGPLGILQQMPTPPPSLVERALPPGLGRVVARAVPRLTGLLAMAEDQPVPANRVRLDASRRDGFGMPRLVVEHRHTRRDEQARAHLLGVGRRVLRQAGALGCYVHRIETFSHAAGTLRMGSDPATSVLDAAGRFRGVENLYVADASALPTCAAVNPSLTIAANALRIGAALTGRDVPVGDHPSDVPVAPCPAPPSTVIA